MKRNTKILFIAIGISFVVAGSMRLLGQVSAQAPPPENPQQDSVGMQGRIPSAPPTTGATISIPRNGQSFTTLPVTVSGICPNGLLVKLFKNNVFAGSVECTNGSFSLITDLFNGQNDLIARVYDSLDQQGPDSNTVNVSFNDNRPGAGSRVSLTSNFAKRGANPGDTLNWPIVLSGGQGPYAISVDWGDGSTVDLISQAFPGTFDIKHVYKSPGIYNIIVKATDQGGGTAFLQLVGVGNGPLKQDAGSSENSDANTTPGQTRILWQPAAILIPFLISTFWLGKRHELHTLRRRIENGERPF